MTDTTTPAAEVDKRTPDEIAKSESELALATIDFVRELVIEDDLSNSIAADELIDIVARRKKLSEKRLEITRPMDAAKALVIDLFRAPDEHLGKAETELRAAITKYQTEQRELAERKRAQEEAAKREETRRANEEADRRRREAEDAIADEQAAQSDDERQVAAQRADEAIAAMEDAHHRADVAAVAPLSSPAPTTVARASGISTRQNWKFSVDDLDKLIVAAAAGLAKNPPERHLAAFLTADATAIGASVRSLKAKAVDQIPGVKVWNEAGLSVSTRGRSK